MLVLLVACRGLGAHHLSVLLRLESLRALVALEFAQISTADGTHARTGPDTHNDFKHTRTQPHANQQLCNSRTHTRAPVFNPTPRSALSAHPSAGSPYGSAAPGLAQVPSTRSPGLHGGYKLRNCTYVCTQISQVCDTARNSLAPRSLALSLPRTRRISYWFRVKAAI